MGFRSSRSRRAAGRAGLCHSQTFRACLSPPPPLPGTSSCRQAAYPRRAGVGHRNKERASEEVSGRVLAAETPSAGLAPSHLQGRGHVKFISPWMLSPHPRQKPGAGILVEGCRGAAPHSYILGMGRGRGPPRPGVLAGRQGERVPWHRPRAGATASSARSQRREARVGLARRYITFCCEHPQENQPAALNGALCSAFFFFIFPPLPASTFARS